MYWLSAEAAVVRDPFLLIHTEVAAEVAVAVLTLLAQYNQIVQH
jgi:hypothetical protein